MNQGVYINGKKAGEISDGCYISHRVTDIHFYVKGRGYPISNEILKQLKSLGVEKIKIVEHGKRATTLYTTTLQKYLNAVLIIEGGFEAQRCVPLVEMEKVSEHKW